MKPSPDTKSCILDIEKMFDEVDEDKNQQLSKGEFQVFQMNTAEYSDLTSMYKVFQIADIDHSGSLSLTELKAFKDTHLEFKYTDKDKDGLLTRTEYYNRNFQDDPDGEEMDKVFQYSDLDLDDMISVKESNIAYDLEI